MNRRVRARDQALRRLHNTVRTIATAAVAGAGAFALVAARTAPGRSVVRLDVVAPTPAASNAAPTTTGVPTTTGLPTTTVGTRAPYHATTPTMPRRAARVVPPVATTGRPVVISGAS